MLTDSSCQGRLDLHRLSARHLQRLPVRRQATIHFIDRDYCIHIDDLVDQFLYSLMYTDIVRVPRLHEDNPRAEAARFTNSGPSFNAAGFGLITRRNTAGGFHSKRGHDTHRPAPQFRAELLLNRGVKAVEIYKYVTEGHSSKWY